MQGSLLPKILARALVLITEVIFVRHLFKAGKPQALGELILSTEHLLW